MMIRDRHAHVDGSGVVYLPYLSSWQPRCDLVRLVQEMSTTFGNDPPLFARPQNQPVQRIPTTPISPSVQIKQDATVRVRRAASLRLAQLTAAIDGELKAQQKLHALTECVELLLRLELDVDGGLELRQPQRSGPAHT